MSRKRRSEHAVGTWAWPLALTLALLGMGCGDGLIEPALAGVSAISIGGQHACALLADGTAACWGNNSSGQLGEGDTQRHLETKPVPVKGLAGIRALAAGNDHTCGLMNDGAVACWGGNTTAESGNGSQWVGVSGVAAEQEFVSSPIAVSGLEGQATLLAAKAWDLPAGGYTCAAVASGTMQCWGEAEVLHAGSMLAAAPTVVTGISHVAGMALGKSHACTLSTDGAISCWGLGALGVSEPTESETPIVVPDLSGATQVAAGHVHACALLSNGTVECWGEGLAVGNGSLAGSATPVSVPGLTRVTAIASAGYQSCALLDDGTVRCWGTWRNGNEGEASVAMPTPVDNVADAIAISVGGTSACALITGGTVECWGDNSAGALGSGSTAPNALLTASTVVAQTHD